jgi:leader peptidase (prepilin peptidase)/N-methyltransferase
MTLYGLFFSFALPLSIIDSEHRRLPHVLTVLAATTGLLSEWAMSRFSMDIETLAFPSAGYLAGFLPLALISLLHPRGLGMGDAFWLGAIGTFVGPLGVLETLLLSTASATGSAVLYWIARKSSGEIGPLRSIMIPFGPFLSLGGAVTLIWGPSLTNFLTAIL